MSNKDVAADASFGAMFVIGLAFLIIGASTNEAFLGVGIAFFAIGAGGWAVYRRRRGKNGKATEDEGSPAEPEKRSGE